MGLEINKKTPHLAVVHEEQGGPANNRPIALLMKSSDDVEYTPELIKAMKDVGLDIPEEIQKAAWYNEKRQALDSLVNEAFGDSDSFCWLVDFNDTTVIYTCKDGMYSVGYSESNGNYSLDSLAKPVMTVVDYVEVDGNMQLSEEAEDAIEAGTLSLAKSCLANEDVQDALDTIFKAVTKKEGNENLPASAYAYVPDRQKPSTWKLRIDDANHTRAAVAALGEGFHGNKVDIPEGDLAAVKRRVRTAYEKFFPENELPQILKSNNDEVILSTELKDTIDLLKSQLSEKDTELTKALEEINKMKQEKADALAAKRKEVLKSLVPSEDLESLFKSLESLNDEHFNTVIKSLEMKANLEKNSDLFKEQGISGDGDVVAQSGIDLVGQIIKNKNKNK